MNRVLLTVDLSNVVYKSCHVHQLLHHQGTDTGGLYGFLTSVATAIKKVGATDVVVCWDAPPYQRSIQYPQYKTLRATTQDPELKERVLVAKHQILELVNLLGLPSWKVPGFEADDLTASVVRRQGWRFSRVVAQSNDQDLAQLLDHPNFRIYKDSKAPLFTADALMKELGVTPAEYVRALALSGTHNEVEGLAGIGPKKSAAIVRDPVKWRNALGQHGDMVTRNLSLITLPHPKFPARDFPLPTADRRTFNLRALYRFAGRFGIDVTPTVANSFEQVLS